MGVQLIVALAEGDVQLKRPETPKVATNRVRVKVGMLFDRIWPIFFNRIWPDRIWPNCWGFT